ncbi:1,4-dihydroxy-2-naphthoate octaprenyltransferase [Comamonadaceae bacterium OH2545_COT-014]|nr:1,4-dihydroxy-2-naphthoate octaprenyltransferase [Comamonadaceae bacterium OH2545_COT-014]
MPVTRCTPAAPSRSLAWLQAARPHTLSLSVAPVVAGCALAWAQGATPRWGLAAITLLAAMLIQVATNLLNDVGDFERGADGADRLGPPRATAQGWLAAAAVRRAGLGALAVAFLLGLGLVWAGGWPIAALGLVSLACGWCYTAGPRPIAYGPLGEGFVWAFFGMAAVAGTFWLQAGALTPAALWLGHMLGALAAGVMLVNNTRDAATDARAGKHTLAVRLGPVGCRVLYALLLAQPYLCWPWLAGHATPAPPAWPWLTLPWALWLCVQLWRQPAGRGLNPLLAHTARLQAAWTALLAFSLWAA